MNKAMDSRSVGRVNGEDIGGVLGEVGQWKIVLVMPVAESYF